MRCRKPLRAYIPSGQLNIPRRDMYFQKCVFQGLENLIDI
jgi:hypothetical protein